MAMKANTLPPFVPTDLRAWIEGDTEEARLVGAIRLIQWIEGPETELPLPLINAAMPDLSQRQLQRVLAKVKARGWLVTKRTAKGRLGRSATTYQLAIEPMAFKNARQIINLRANLAPRSEEPTRQLELTKTPKSTDLDATQASPNIKEKDLQERQVSTAANAAGQAPAAEPAAFNPFGYLMAAFKKLPSPPIITERTGVDIGRVNTKARKLGQRDFQRVVDAYCKDEYTGKSIANFLMCFDRLANKLLGAEREVRARRQRELKAIITDLKEQQDGRI